MERGAFKPLFAQIIGCEEICGLLSRMDLGGKDGRFAAGWHHNNDPWGER